MNHIIKINHTTTYTDKEKHRVRIIAFGDVHYGQKMKIEKLKRVFQLAESLNPNYIFLLGDNLDSTNVIDCEKEKNDFLNLLTYSGEIAPTLIGLADHDQRYHDTDGVMRIDFRNDFWKSVDELSNVYVLNNSGYEDELVQVLGYTLPSYYYHGKYPLPIFSKCSSTRADEDVSTLIEDMHFNEKLFRYFSSSDKYRAVLFHSPQHLDNETVTNYLKDFNFVFSGHMHQGCMPPIIDDIIPGNSGIISPQRTLFPHKARGIIETSYGTLCIINGGITKIPGSKAVLRPFNGVFPMHMDVVDIVPQNGQGEVSKQYTKKAYYRYVK